MTRHELMTGTVECCGYPRWVIAKCYHVNAGVFVLDDEHEPDDWRDAADLISEADGVSYAKWHSGMPPFSAQRDPLPLPWALYPETLRDPESWCADPTCGGFS